MARKGGLGRGLSALIPEAEQAPRDERVPATEVPIGDVIPNPQQPHQSRLKSRKRHQNRSTRSLGFGVKKPANCGGCARSWRT